MLLIHKGFLATALYAQWGQTVGRIFTDFPVIKS